MSDPSSAASADLRRATAEITHMALPADISAQSCRDLLGAYTSLLATAWMRCHSNHLATDPQAQVLSLDAYQRLLRGLCPEGFTFTHPVRALVEGVAIGVEMHQAMACLVATPDLSDPQEEVSTAANASHASTGGTPHRQS